MRNWRTDNSSFVIPHSSLSAALLAEDGYLAHAAIFAVGIR